MGRPRTDIRPRIVRAARACFLVAGVDGASLRTIASDAGTNIGMVFYYFPTKDELFLAVVEDVYATLLGDLAAALSGSASLRERLQRAFVRIGSATDDELSVVRLVVREVLLSSERFARVFARMQRGHLALFMKTLGDAVIAGELDRSVSPALLLLSTFALGGLPQLVRRAGNDRGPFAGLPPPEVLASTSVDLLLRAIGSVGTAKATRGCRARPKDSARARRGRP